MIAGLSRKEKEVIDSKAAAAQMVDSLNHDLRRETTRLKEHAEKKIQDFVRQIEENQRLLLDQLRDSYKCQMDDLAEQIQDLEGVASNLVHVRAFAERLVEYGSSAQVMTSWRSVSEQVNELMAKETRHKQTGGDYAETRFIPNDEPSTVQDLGVIKSSLYEVTIAHRQFYRKGDKVPVALKIPGGQMKASASLGDVKATITTPTNTTEKLTVTTKKDGTFYFECTPQVEGKHEISMSVLEERVRGSPVKINVIPNRGLSHRFCRKGSGEGECCNPMGVVLTKKKDVVVCDRFNERLQCFDMHGNHRCTVKVDKSKKPFQPRHAAVAQSGNYFVTSGGKRQIFVFNENHKLVGWYSLDEVKWPMGIAVCPKTDMIYVVDYEGKSIHIYDENFKHVASFGCKGKGNGQFLGPYCVCVTIEGKVIVSDKSKHNIQIFRADGQYLDSFGSHGTGDYQFNGPCGIAVDKVCNLYVCDSGNNRVHKFDNRYRFVGFVNCQADQLNCPLGVCVTDDEPLSKVIVTEFEGNRISVFNQ